MKVYSMKNPRWITNFFAESSLSQRSYKIVYIWISLKLFVLFYVFICYTLIHLSIIPEKP
jgi:hypothetical protein